MCRAREFVLERLGVFRLGYNTNGLAHHRLTDALALLAELGYEGVAITPDVGQLDLYDLDRSQVYEVRARASELGLDLTIETGARFVLDPRRKHFPTLLEASAADRERRLDFLRRSLDLAAELGAGVVSIWSGSAPPGAGAGELWERLAAGVGATLVHARNVGVQLAFEPEPGMFVERPAGYLELVERLGAEGGELGLCLDVGHLLVTGDLPVGDQIRALAPRLIHVHLDDVRDGRHEHLMFGEGVLNLHEALTALLDTGYRGMAAVELSRDSHRGAWAAQESLVRIRAALADLNRGS